MPPRSGTVATGQRGQYVDYRAEPDECGRRGRVFVDQSRLRLRASQSTGRQRLSTAECYAAEKAAVEQSLLAAGSLATICRLAKVLTGRLPLVAHWLTDLAANRPISAFNDLNVSPVSLGYVAEFLLRAIRQPQGGIFQISGAQELSYCALAKALAKRCGSPASLVHCRSGHEAGIDLPAFPRHPSLDGSRTRAILGLSPQPLPDLLDELVISFEESRVAIKS